MKCISAVFRSFQQFVIWVQLGSRETKAVMVNKTILCQTWKLMTHSLTYRPSAYKISYYFIHLHSLVIMSKRKSECDSPAKENKRPKISGSQTVRSFKAGNAWLRYDAKSKSMFCDYCIKSQRQNIFTKGCSILKKESVSKHVISKGKPNWLIA